MRECMLDFYKLLNSNINNAIWVQTTETERFLADFNSLNKQKNLYKNIVVWDCATGLCEYNQELGIIEPHSDKNLAKRLFQPTAFLAHLNMLRFESTLPLGKGAIFIIRNFQLINGVTPQVTQLFVSLFETKSINRPKVILMGDTLRIEPEQEKLITVFNYDLPDEKEIGQIVDQFKKQLKIDISVEDTKNLVSACKGLTFDDIVNTFKKSVQFKGGLDIAMVQNEKIEIIKKSGCLDYVIVGDANIDDMGGNENFKSWLKEMNVSRTDAAKEFGVAPAKGYIAFGVAGSGKTESAKMVAAMMKVPLLELNFSKIMGSMVGQSERAVDRALRTVKAVAPCVLLLDESEKTLGGYKSSASSDSGTLSRVLSRILNFLQDESTDVFTVMTSNDISKLPPELMRSGRLDTHWFFDIPNETERRDIIDIYLTKKNKKLTKALKDYAVDATNHFTGAEIKGFVENLVRKLFIARCEKKTAKITEEMIDAAAEEIVPVFKSSSDTVTALQTYAESRARFASNRPRVNQYSLGDLNISL